MNNLLNAISALSSDDDLKTNFINEFDEQINSIQDDVEKWENYKTFLQESETLLLFIDKYDYIFIVNELIIKAIDGSNLSKDNLSIIFFDELEKYFYIKITKGINSDELEHSKDLLRDFGLILKQNFLDGSYSGLENHEFYIGLKNNINFLYIILYIVLSYMKSNSDYKEGDLPDFFNGIYQYYHLHRQKNEFSVHLILITFIAIFFETQNKTFNTQGINHSSHRENHSISELIESISLENTDEEFYKVFDLLKEFNLLFKFLVKLEHKDWISDEFIKKNIKLLLFKDNLLSNKNIISFSNIFLNYEKELYSNAIRGIDFNEEEILSAFKTTKKDTIVFLNIDENKKYINGEIKEEIKNILKEELVKNIGLDNNYYSIYKYIINLGEKLDLLLNDFEYDLVSEFINDEEGLSFTLKNIDKFLIKKDLEVFHYSLIKKYIENMTSGEFLSAKDIRETLELKDKTIKDILKKIKNEGILIKGATGISRYEVI